VSDHLLSEIAGELAGLAAEDTKRTGISALLEAISARPGERPEDVLLDLKLVDDRSLAFTLAMRSGRRYEGLLDAVPDPRLFLYVPLGVATRQRSLPLVLVDNTLTIASAYLDPDLSVVRERFPNLRLDLVVAPRTEILAAIDRVGL
jgi:hypothetical protein